KDPQRASQPNSQVARHRSLPSCETRRPKNCTVCSPRYSSSLTSISRRSPNPRSRQCRHAAKPLTTLAKPTMPCACCLQETIGNSMHRTGMSVDHQPRPTPEWSEEHIADRRRSQNPSVSSSDCDLRGEAERRLLGQASPRRRSQGKEPAASPVNWIKLNGLGLSSETGCVVNEATLSGEAE